MKVFGEYSTIYLSIPLLIDIWIIYNSLLLWKCFSEFLVHASFCIYEIISLRHIPRGGIAGSKVLSTFNFTNQCQVSLQTGLSVSHPTQGVTVLIASHSHQLLALSDFSDYANLMSVGVLSLISLIASETEHYARCLLAIWLSSSFNFLLMSFAHFPVNVLSFPYLSHLSISHCPNQTSEHL